MGGFFSSGDPPVKSGIGAWSGVKPVQSGLTGLASGAMSGLGSNLNQAQGLWSQMMQPGYTDVTKNPGLMNAVNAAMGPAMDYFNNQTKGLRASETMSGNTPGYSTGSDAALNQLFGQQGTQLAQQSAGIMLPLQQQLMNQQAQASQMPLSLMQLFTQLAGAGGGSTMVGQASPSPFSQLLGLGTTAAGLGWSPFSGGGSGGGGDTWSPNYAADTWGH